MNNLIADYKKPWLNARVNDLKIDGLTEFVNAADFANGISVGTSGDVMESYEETTIAAELGGTFIAAPLLVTLRLIKIGKLVQLTLPSAIIDNADLNASGTVSLEADFTSIPDFLPRVSGISSGVSIDNSSGTVSAARSFLAYSAVNDVNINILDGYSSSSFTKGGSNFRVLLTNLTYESV